VYDYCSDELKKILDQGRNFKEKLMEEEDAKRNALTDKIKKEEDVVMKDSNEEEKKGDEPMVEEEKVEAFYDHTGKRLTGAAAKAEMKKQNIIKHDKKLYREHGVGLDTGDY